MAWDVYSEVSRSGGPLVITNTGDPTCPYVIAREGIGPGSVTWRKVIAQSPFVAGRYIVGAVKDSVGTTLTVRVRGQSYDWLDYYIQQLVEAFEQLSYVLTLTINGVTHQWNCESADWALGNGGQLVDLEAMSWTQIVKFSIQRNPVPLSGRF